MARLTCSVRAVQLRIESRLWMEKLEDQLMSAFGKLQRGMRWPGKVRFEPFMSVKPRPFNRIAAMRLTAGKSPKLRYQADNFFGVWVP
jgi:hypothetical protein